MSKVFQVGPFQVGAGQASIGDAKRAPLTPREGQVLEQLLLGESNKEIAAHLGCTDKAIEFHVSNILRKTGMPSRLRLLASRVNG